MIADVITEDNFGRGGLSGIVPGLLVSPGFGTVSWTDQSSP